ncbi:DNA-binding NarL/FixJ family response regulator [Inquilinus ginsengisoli]|uniref:LuxR family transcriptional regulator n=1 Tax=Inquilinus ginsengisoli TaxID=363840 RepID=UPI003D229393
MLAYKQKAHNLNRSAAIAEWTPPYEAETKCALAPTDESSTQAVAKDGPDTSLIAIVDRRALGREVLTTALATANGGFNSRTYAEIGEWLIDENRHSTSAILLGIGGIGSDNPDLAADLRCLAREYPQIPVLVMGDIEDPYQIIEFLSHGVRGCIPTTASLGVAIGALSLAIAGGVFVPASALLDTSGAPRQLPPDARSVFGLTARQAAIADGICRGKPNKVIAYELNLSESTVKVHIRGIMKKLQARNRTEVAFRLHATKAGPRWPMAPC